MHGNVKDSPVSNQKCLIVVVAAKCGISSCCGYGAITLSPMRNEIIIFV